MDTPGEFFDLAPQIDPWLDPPPDESEEMSRDIAFYRTLAEEAPGPALELGVGTGRVYLELLDAGLDVDGIDVSEGSLDQLRERAEVRGGEPSVWLSDMTTLEVDRQYGLIYAPARAFNHLSRLADQQAALENIHAALLQGGTYALNTFVPEFDVVVETYGEPDEDEMTVDGDTHRIVATSYLENEVEQVARIHRELYLNDEFVAERETSFALIPKRQFELLFSLTGFEDRSVFGHFEYEPLERADQEMVWLATK